MDHFIGIRILWTMLNNLASSSFVHALGPAFRLETLPVIEVGDELGSGGDLARCEW